MCEVLGYVSNASNAKSVKYGHLGPPRCLSSLPKHLLCPIAFRTACEPTLSFANLLCIAIRVIMQLELRFLGFGFRVSGKVRSRESAQV